MNDDPAGHGTTVTVVCPPLRGAPEATALLLAATLDLVDALGPGRVRVAADPEDLGLMRAVVPPGTRVTARAGRGPVVDGRCPPLGAGAGRGLRVDLPADRTAIASLLRDAGEPSPAPRTRSLLHAAGA